MRSTLWRGAPLPLMVTRPTARLALHHLLDETHMGMGDARKKIKPNLVGDVQLVAVKMTSSRTCVETT